MLGSLNGTVTGRLSQRILIEVNGVGYWVHTGSWQPEGIITCYLYHHVREEASDLYGFPDLATLELFEQLISISGIGPKAGLSLLSLGAERLKQAIVSRDSAFLTHAPGIGQKAAQKILLELEGKVQSTSGLASPSTNELAAALEGLGYKPADIRRILPQLPPDLSSLDTQLKWALSQLH